MDTIERTPFERLADYHQKAGTHLWAQPDKDGEHWRAVRFSSDGERRRDDQADKSEEPLCFVCQVGYVPRLRLRRCPGTKARPVRD